MSRSRPFAAAAGLVLFLAALLALPRHAGADYLIKDGTVHKGAQVDALPWLDNRTHRFGTIWLTVNNWGWLGNFNDYDTDAYTDAEVLDWAPQCEVPGGSRVQYLFAAGLWVGALIVEESGLVDPRVSTGADGYVAGEAHEFYPDDRTPIAERSTRSSAYNGLGDYVTSELAVSEQDFIAVYSDTLVDSQLTPPVGGVVHKPLGIRITQKSYSWSYEYASRTIIIDYEVENIAERYLKNLYIGLYVDGDVGRRGYSEKNLDDIAGFIEQAYDSARGEWIAVNTAWIADNDGRDADVDVGNQFTAPHVTGFRVLRSPNPKLRTSFNWWTSSLSPEQDYGPAWRSWTGNPDGAWSLLRGTPLGDREKYFILSNGEFDYNQWHVDDPAWIAAHPQDFLGATGNLLRREEWQDPSESGVNAADVANGYDTRYLISWGPMGVFDHVDNTGRWIYRLNPGEKFSFTVALVAGLNLHDVNQPQQPEGPLDPSRYNFRGLENSALWAQRIYDNEMVDTPVFDFGEDGIPDTNDLGEGDGVLDTGDGWFGEDAGSDGLYAILPADQDSVAVWYFGHFMGWYTGPDADGSENNGRLDPGEDELLWSLQNFVADSGFVWAGPKLSRGGHAWVKDGAGGRRRISLGERDECDWFIGHLNLNGVLDRGDGIPDFQGPPPPPPPVIVAETGDDEIILRWKDNAERYVDPFSHLRDFEGYRVWVANDNLENRYGLLGEWDEVNYAYYDAAGRLRSMPDRRGFDEAPPDSTDEMWNRWAVGPNNGLQVIRRPHGWTEPFTDLNGDLVWNAPEPYADQNGNERWDPGEPFQDLNANHRWDAGEPYEDLNADGEFTTAENYTVYELRLSPVRSHFPRWYAVTAYDFGDFMTGTEPLESARTANAVRLAPSGLPTRKVGVVPNPYRMDLDYTQRYMEGFAGGGGLSWENQWDDTPDYWPQQDRRLDFINLPRQCLIRIYTVAGDLVQILPHNVAGDANRRWASPHSESWDLNSRNYQQVAPGLYYFSVEDKTPEGEGAIQTGTFVIIG
ncbi:MAG: hypothetical protein Q8O14_02715 [bacterium]|jgi:hypothetical protein|nr:hypothetical protein [bacterium]